MKKLTRSQINQIALEMFEEGSYYSESYSKKRWEKNNWPLVDDDILYKILDSKIRFLRLVEEYEPKE